MTSIFEHLREDHQRIKRALVRLRGVERGADPTPHLHEVLRRYTAHARAEEHIFYSYLIHIRSVQQRAILGIAEHERLDALLREAELLKRDDPAWYATISALSVAMEQHLREEEGSVFALARGALSEREANELGARFAAERARVYRDLSVLSESHAALAEPAPARRPAPPR